MHRLLRGVPLAWFVIITTNVAAVAQPASDEDVATRSTAIPGTDVAAGQICDSSLMEDVSSAERAAHETVRAVDGQPQHEVVERTFLNVPAGNAVRVAYRPKDAPDGPRFVLNASYVPGRRAARWGRGTEVARPRR